MESLKKLGVVFSAHYEKIILSVILLALLGAGVLAFRAGGWIGARQGAIGA